MSTLINLCKERVTTDIIGALTSSKTELTELDTTNYGNVIILDGNTAEILSSFLTVSELMWSGKKILSVDNLMKNRKPLKNVNGIYLITPTMENIQKVIDDFQIEDKPKYKNIHIYFTENLPNNLLDNLATQNIINHIRTCKIMDIPFHIKDKNLFSLEQKLNLRIFGEKKSEEYVNTKMKEISNKLASICHILNVHPNIQYQKSSVLCKKAARELAKILDKYKAKKLKKSGILLITDRTFDPMAPVLHDYSYGALINDLFSVKKNNLIIDSDKSEKLEMNDKLWAKYKNIHFVKMFEEISKDFKDFLETDAGQVGKNNLDSFRDMEKAISNMKSYKEQNALFSKHINIAKQLNNKFKDNLLSDILELEQDIVSGLTVGGDIIEPKKMFKVFQSLTKKLENNYQHLDVLRLLVAIMCCIDIKESEFIELTQGLLEKKDKFIFDGLKLMGIDIESAKLKMKSKGRRRNINDEFNIEDKKERKKLKEKMQQKLSEIEYKTLRTTLNIENLLVKGLNNTLNTEDYPFEDEPENIKININNNKKFGIKHFLEDEEEIEDNDYENNDELDTKQSFIYFNIGGLCYNEIAALNNIKKEQKNNFRLFIGSTGIYNAKEYLDELSNLGKFKSNIGFDEDEKDEDEDLTTELNKLNDDNKVKIELQKKGKKKAKKEEEEEGDNIDNEENDDEEEEIRPPKKRKKSESSSDDEEKDSKKKKLLKKKKK